MAQALDLQEQEQIEELKAFWKRFGNLITWTITLALLAFAAWNGWQWWQRDQAAKAAVLYDEVDRAASAGDAERAARIAADLRERFGATTAAAQGALLAARSQFDKGRADDARTTLAWVADHAGDPAYRTIARLQLAGLHLDAKKPDDALKAVDAAAPDAPAAFAGLVADRRGDVLLAMGRRDDARAAYQSAWKAMDPAVDYRRAVGFKLTALGAPPEAAAAAVAVGTAPAAAARAAASGDGASR